MAALPAAAAALAACGGGGASPGGAPGAVAEPIASALGRGTRLVYASGGRTQPAWTIDAVERDFSLGGRDGCVRVVLRTEPSQPPVVRTTCRGGDTLFTWEPTAREWRLLRPVGPGMTLDVPAPDGATLRFTTGELGVARISGQRFPIVHTTVVTMDARGRPTRRLTERYSVALATAVGGVLEVPDSTLAGAWREAQRFELVRVE